MGSDDKTLAFVNQLLVAPTQLPYSVDKPVRYAM
jgi:hypothetical protein